ncbi:restriction endonuclease subunit S [Acinetobacter nosocomialis]|uniref:restriction endonuclease subunit S n=1 Tax=Acinetobacter nosocomialis TaxID=106654 RepID=UPI00280E33DA|nr:restriction endonuclease subunit S [Acinetobacter nosocomialis]MDQ9056121.1 restriction endonuclease subunit S [Acinetobacter nosocomialis]
MSQKEWLPNGWVIAKVGDYLFLKNGFAFKSNSYVQPNDVTYPVIRISDIDGMYASDADAIHVSDPVVGFEVCKGDLLIAMSGATTGKIGVYKGKEPAFQNQRVGNLKLRSDKLGSTRFRNYLIASLSENILKEAYGGAQPNISGKAIENMEIQLPPLAEQKVIADKLDTLLAQVESIKARLERIPEILKQFRQSVLAAAVSGKLTEEWRGKQLGSSPITRKDILEARKSHWEHAEYQRLCRQDKVPTNEKWRAKYKDPESVLNEDCFALPAGWLWTNLGELAWSVKDGPHFSPKYTQEGVPFISGGNITEKGINFTQCKFISNELHEELSKRCKPEIGDILYTKGGTTGIAYFNQESRDFNVWVHVAVLKITNVIDGNYLAKAMNSSHCYQLSQRYTHGVGNQDLGLTRLIKITVPIPPLEEQLEIINRVDQLFSTSESIEQQVLSALDRVNNLTQSILSKAFRGELTAEWREANPELISGENSAEALLERIKAERSAKSVTKPGRGKA